MFVVSTDLSQLCIATVFAHFFLASSDASPHNTRPVLFCLFVGKFDKNLHLKEAARQITDSERLRSDISIKPSYIFSVNEPALGCHHNFITWRFSTIHQNQFLNRPCNRLIMRNVRGVFWLRKSIKGPRILEIHQCNFNDRNFNRVMEEQAISKTLPFQ